MRLFYIFSVYILFFLMSAALPLRAQSSDSDAAASSPAQSAAVAPAAAPAPVVSAAQSSSPPFAPASAQAMPPEQVELRKLSTDNMIADQKTKKKLQQLSDEKEGLRAQYELDQQRQKAKVVDMEAELYRLSTANKIASEKNQEAVKLLLEQLEKATIENKLADEKHKEEVDALEAQYQMLAAQNKVMTEQSKALMQKQSDELQLLGLENKIADENSKKAIAELSQRLDKLKAANDLKAEQQRELSIADYKERNAIDLETKRLDLVERRLKISKMEADSRMTQLDSDLELRGKKEEWKKEANTEPLYLSRPFQDGRLVVSDRRIPLNGPIFNGSADEVTDRIHYFNNISTSPVFIVIDNSPGGSVMAGYRILKAMQASKAPVYVVVKSFAASMAAVITTMADQSYVYTNAIILHHQMSSMNWGNITELKEQLEMARQWEQRLHEPVAKKMGITMDEFRKKMYEKNSDGDWQEFGDKAVDYKWATSVVDRIEETGFIKNPDAEADAKPAKRSYYGDLDEKTDEKGQRYAQLPRLDPYDFYFIYNPDRYYR